MPLTEETKRFLIDEKGKLIKLAEAIEAIQEMYGSHGNDELADACGDFADSLYDMESALSGGDPEKMETAFSAMQGQLNDFLFEKYPVGENGEEKSGIEILMGKNFEGVPLFGIKHNEFLFLEDMCSQLGIKSSQGYSQEKKDEITREIRNLFDSASSDIRKIRDRDKNNLDPAFLATIDVFLEKTKPGPDFNFNEAAGALDNLRLAAEEHGHDEIRRKANACTADISRLSLDFSFLTDDPGKVQQKEKIIPQEGKNGPGPEVIRTDIRPDAKERILPQQGKTGAALSGKPADPNDGKLKSALDLFNTKRRNIFGGGRIVDSRIGRETEEHIRLRMATEELIVAKKHLQEIPDEVGSPNWKKAARDVYKKADNVADLTKEYAEKKHYFSNFGQDRLSGASDLLGSARSIQRDLVDKAKKAASSLKDRELRETAKSKIKDISINDLARRYRSDDKQEIRTFKKNKNKKVEKQLVPEGMKKK